MLEGLRPIIPKLHVALMLGFLGCSQSEEVVGPLDESFATGTESTLGQRRFVFPAGAGVYEDGDPRQGQSTTVTIGRFNPAARLAAFSAVSDDGSIEGGYLQLDELCVFVTTYRALAGQAPVTPELAGDVLDEAFYESCGIDPQGRLGLYSKYRELQLVSDPSERAPEDFSTRVALSNANVGAEPRPSSGEGAFELSLSAGVMSYAMASAGPATSTWSSAHIHRGMAGSNGETWLPLFNSDEQSFYVPLPSAGHIVASIFVTPEQSRLLESGDDAIYVDAHLGELTPSLGGQIQPPLHPLTGIVASTQPSKSAGAVPTVEGTRVKTSDQSGVIYELHLASRSAPPARPTALSMTPAASVIGVPASGPTVAAVVLDPAGSRFVHPVELTFSLPDTVDRSSLLAFHYSPGDTGLHFIPLFPGAATENGIKVSITRFSTVGLVEGDPADLAANVTADPSTYQEFQGMMADEVGGAAAGQLLGAGDELPADVLNRLRTLFQDVADTVLLPELRAASNFEKLEAALSDISQWSVDAQDVFGNLDGFSSELDRFHAESQNRLDALFSEFETKCLEMPDPCDRQEAAATLSQWHEHVGFLGTALGASLSVPSFDAFCNGVMNGAVDHIDVAPTTLMVLQGGRFELEATPKTWDREPIDTPIRWTSSSPSVLVLDTESSGRGTAVSVGTAEIVVSTPEMCANEGVAVVNVRSLSGTWKVRTISSEHDCAGISTSPPLSIASVTQSSGGHLVARHPDYGTVEGRIDNLQMLRTGAASEPYRFTLGPFSSSDTPDCYDYLNDIEEFLSRGGINFCADSECRAISCVDTELLKGVVGPDGVDFRADNDWSTEEVFEVFIGDPPQWERLTESCGGTDKLRAVIQ